MPLIRAYRPRYMPRVKVHRVFPRKKRVRFAKKVKAVINKVRETRIFNITATYADLEAASQRIIHVTPIDQGNAPENRDGQVIEPIRLRARIAIKAIAVTGPCVARVMLIRYKQCDGTAPTLADILPQANADLTMLPVDIPLNDNLGAFGYGLPQATRKFQVLYDKVRHFSVQDANSDNNFRLFTINKKLSGKIYYTGALGTDEGNNQLYLFIHTDAGDDIIEECHDIRFMFKDA